MRRGFGILAGFAAVALAATAAYTKAKPVKPDTPTPKSTTAKPAKRAAPGQPASFADDMEKLKTTVGLDEEQQKKLADLKAARDAALANWDQLNDKRIAAIEARIAAMKGGKDAKAKAQLERQLKTLRAGRERVAATHERTLFGVLTREQRGKYNGPILAEAMLKEYARVTLDDAQTQKLRELCQARGEGVTAPVDPVLHLSTYKALKQQVYASILTPDQRKQYSGANKPSTPVRKTPTRTTKTRK
jgi:hypothetical protein